MGIAFFRLARARSAAAALGVDTVAPSLEQSVEALGNSGGEPPKVQASEQRPPQQQQQQNRNQQHRR